MKLGALDVIGCIGCNLMHGMDLGACVVNKCIAYKWMNLV